MGSLPADAAQIDAGAGGALELDGAPGDLELLEALGRDAGRHCQGGEAQGCEGDLRWQDGVSACHGRSIIGVSAQVQSKPEAEHRSIIRRCSPLRHGTLIEGSLLRTIRIGRRLTNDIET